MAFEWILALTFFVIGGIVLIAIIIMLYWWFKTKGIKKLAPAFEGDMQDFRILNYDRNITERRMLNKNRQNGITERRIGQSEEGIRRVEGETDDEEIARIRAEVQRLRRETRGN